jgi:hypothetical protein
MESSSRHMVRSRSTGPNGLRLRATVFRSRAFERRGVAGRSRWLAPAPAGVRRSARNERRTFACRRLCSAAGSAVGSDTHVASSAGATPSMNRSRSSRHRNYSLDDPVQAALRTISSLGRLKLRRRSPALATPDASALTAISIGQSGEERRLRRAGASATHVLSHSRRPRRCSSTPSLRLPCGITAGVTAKLKPANIRYMGRDPRRRSRTPSSRPLRPLPGRKRQGAGPEQQRLRELHDLHDGRHRQSARSCRLRFRQARRDARRLCGLPRRSAQERHGQLNPRQQPRLTGARLRGEVRLAPQLATLGSRDIQQGEAAGRPVRFTDVRFRAPSRGRRRQRARDGGPLSQPEGEPAPSRRCTRSTDAPRRFSIRNPFASSVLEIERGRPRFDRVRAGRAAVR